jgi:hypothetical protein
MNEIVATIALVVIAWLIYLIPAVSLSLPLCLLGRKRARFTWWEAGVFVVPFIVWLVCFQLLPGSRSLGNIVEALILGCVIPLGVLIRVILGGNSNTLVALGVIGLVCALAVLLVAAFPEVPFHWSH